MLDFYLGLGGFSSSKSSYLGGLDVEAIYWLQQHDFIVKGISGHLPEDPPESFPVGDDIVLSYEQVLIVFDKFQRRLELALQTEGFNSEHVNTLGSFLKLAIEKKCGLSTISD